MDGDTPDADLNSLRGLFTGSVRQRIANAKFYPRVARRRGMEGRPIIAFTLDRQGQLMEVDLAETSGINCWTRRRWTPFNKGLPTPKSRRH